MSDTQNKVIDLFKEYGLIISYTHIEQAIQEYKWNFCGNETVEEFYEEIMGYTTGDGMGQPIMVSDGKVFQQKIWNKIHYEKGSDWIFRGLNIQFNESLKEYHLKAKQKDPFKMWVMGLEVFEKGRIEQNLPEELYKEYSINEMFYPEQAQKIIQGYVKKKIDELSELIHQSGFVEEFNLKMKKILTERYKKIINEMG